MNAKIIACITCFFLIFFSSCVPIQETEIANNIDTYTPKSPILHYNVYEQGAASGEEDEFSAAMSQNPISTKMDEEIETLNISSAYDSRMFFDKYVGIWQDELTFSISNLKKYLSDTDIILFNKSQADWEKSRESSNEFDRILIDNSEIVLGAQYSSSSLIYSINQYQSRVFHIKYMTYLMENYVENPISSEDQLWNQFYDFN